MAYLFGFLFTLLKISAQAAAYATLLRWLVRWLAGKQVNSRVMRFSHNSRAFWQRSFVVVYAGLFLFSLTYWGDHGLGDSARIPLGHGEAIVEINGTETLFETATPIILPTDAPFVDKFRVAGDVLCGQAGSTYFTYNLATKQQALFADSKEYTSYARQRSLPSAGELRSFGEACAQYWGGWRFWLLA